MSGIRAFVAGRSAAAALVLAGLVAVSLAGRASGQSLLQPWEPTPSGPARGKTCTQIDHECPRGFGSGGKAGRQSARCTRIWEFCIKTGVYHDGKRTITGVVRE